MLVWAAKAAQSGGSGVPGAFGSSSRKGFVPWSFTSGRFSKSSNQPFILP